MLVYVRGANWPIFYADGVPITATATSAATLIESATPRIAGEDVLIDNPGPLDVFVKAGGSTVVATVTSVRVPGGSLQPYRKGADTTHLAVISPDGSQAIVVHVGDGQ